MTERIVRAAIALLLAGLTARAAEPDDYRPYPPLPLGGMLLTLPSPRVAAAGTWHLQFVHRFLQDAGSGSFEDQLRSLWGLDGGANVGIGVSWIPRRDLELSLMRTNTLDVYELGAKYLLLEQAQAVPVTVALRGGIDVRTGEDLEDRFSPFVQAIISRRLRDRAEIFLLPTVVTNAGRASDGIRSHALFSRAATVGLAATYMVGTNLSLIAEIIPPNRDLPPTIDREPSWSIGVKRAFGGHHFEVLVSNTPALTVDEYSSGTFLGAALDPGAVHVGFNVRRSFGGMVR